jgi:hypothetical protein
VGILSATVLDLSAKVASPSSNGNRVGVFCRPWLTTNFTTPFQFSSLANLGVKWVRVDVDNPLFKADQTMINALVPRGVNLIGLISGRTLMQYYPDWPNWTLTDWQNGIDKVIPMWSPYVHVWEIWQEAEYYSGGYLGNPHNNLQGSVSNYITMLKYAYQKIKANNPKDIVLGLASPSLQNGGYIMPPNLPQNPVTQGFDYKWIKACIAGGVRQYCDGVTIHAYTNGTDYQLDDLIPYWNITVLQSWHNVFSAYESLLDNTPVWITETGDPSYQPVPGYYPLPPSGPPTPQSQARFLQMAFDWLLAWPNVRLVSWYQAFDFGPWNTNPDNIGDFGLFDITTGNPKLAMSVMKNRYLT